MAHAVLAAAPTGSIVVLTGIEPLSSTAVLQQDATEHERIQLLSFLTLFIVLFIFKAHNVSCSGGTFSVGTSCIDVGGSGNFHLKTETESSLLNVI
jgi:hypothetical protein